MNRTIKEATIHRYHYADRHQLRRHLADFIAAYNFGHRVKTLKGLTSYKFICKCWANQSERVKLDPIHQMPGLSAWYRLSANPSRQHSSAMLYSPRNPSSTILIFSSAEWCLRVARE
jgi:hypothetical protein